MKPLFLTTDQIAQICGISPKYISKYVEEHELPAFKDSESGNASWKARYESLVKWAARHEARFVKKRR